MYLKMDFERNFCTWRFFLIIVLIPILMIVCDLDTIQGLWKWHTEYGFTCSLKSVQEILIFDRFKTVMTVMLSAISCFTVSDDIHTHYDRMILCRMGIGKYCMSKLMMNALAIISAVVTGFLLYVVVLLPIMPLVNEEYVHSGDRLANGPMAACVLVVIWAVIFALYVVFLTTFSMWVTVYRPNRYVAIALPFAMFYILYTLTTVPGKQYLNLWYISSGVDVLQSGNVAVTLAYAAAVFGLLTALCGLGFYRAMARRVKDGKL